MFTGHPKGLFRLFFIEMWERLAFYTMVGILLLYTIDSERGGLGLSRVVGNEIYGLYLAFVYFTPYLGGLLADRFLGYRRSVLIGGLFFATGFLLMGIYGSVTFVSGLICLCIGNGFFKPNISVMVGNLYEPGDPKRDAGFNIFYMGINIGAFVANFLAATMRNQFGWSWVFWAAAIGMLVGVTILLASWKVLERADRPPEQGPDDTSFREIFNKILIPALVFGVIGYFVAKNTLPEGFALRPAVCGFLAGMIPILIFFVRLGTRAKEDEKPGLLALLPVYLAGATFFMVLHLNGSAMTSWALDKTDRQVAIVPAGFQQDALPSYYHNASPDTPRPNRLSLLPVPTSEIASQYGQNRLGQEAFAAVEAMLPAGVRVADIPAESRSEAELDWDGRAADLYQTVTVETTTDSHGVPTVSVSIEEGAKPERRVAFVRKLAGGQDVPLFLVAQDVFDDMYSGEVVEMENPGEYLQVTNSELFQSLNALFVIGFTPLVIWFFTRLRRSGVDFSTARKIFVGMLLTTVALLLMVLAGFVGDNGAQKVSWLWLVLFYAVVTLGELCLSPMALSLVTKLSPRRLVGLTMGGWFLATAFGNNFSGFFGGLESQMSPTSFFLVLAGVSGAVSLIILMLLPKLDAAIKKYGA